MFLVDISGFFCNIDYTYKDIGKPGVRSQGGPFLSSPVKAPWTHGIPIPNFPSGLTSPRLFLPTFLSHLGSQLDLP